MMIPPRCALHLTRRLTRTTGSPHLEPPRSRALSVSSHSQPSNALAATDAAALGNRQRQLTRRRSARMWLELSKFRLSAMVVLSSGAGFVLAGPPFAVDKLIWVTSGTALAAASASVFNQVYERHTDSLMKRTRSRPLPSGQISSSAALASGVALGAASVGVLGLGTNAVVTGLGLANIVLYAGVYTPMKQTSTWNTWVGAVVGAIPPLMGYAAATGGELLDSTAPILLSTGVFLWQFPHFFALSWLLKRDYARGGHRMVPCVDGPEGRLTGNILVRYSGANALIPFIAYASGASSVMFPLEAALYNGYMMLLCERFRRQANDENARRVFRFSLAYLPLFMGSMVFHSKLDRRGEDEGNRDFLRIGDASLEDFRRKIAEKLCLHEILVGEGKWFVVVKGPPDNDHNPGNATGLLPKDNHPGFCPVTKLETAVDETKAAVRAAATASSSRASSSS